MPTPHKLTTTQRGLGATHQRIAKQLKLAALGRPCPGGADGIHSPRCIGTMTNTRQMHADHSTARTLGGTKADRVCCVSCNTSHGARLAHQLAGHTTPTPTLLQRRTSRRWW